MSAPRNEYAFDLEVALAAARRWESREDRHAKFEQSARRNNYSELDTQERREKRAMRLLARLRRAAPQVAQAFAAEFRESAAGRGLRGHVGSVATDDLLLERVIGKTRDFLFVEFLDQAVYGSRAVGRLVTKLGSGRFTFGTGFMVSPRLLLTNHHVLGSPDTAAASQVEFDYQRDRLGQPLAVRAFDLDPSAFFLSDKELDFALVAVGPRRKGLPASDLGWCPLIREEGKIVIGEPINIVQHPRGEMKQAIIRENRLVDLLELHAHYEADTEPGSSGSPVFNNEWEVVALHHSGVPRKNGAGELLRKDGQVWRRGDPPELLDWVANEGIRVSRLVDFISRAAVTPSALPLLRELLDSRPSPESGPPSPEPRPTPAPPESGPGRVSITVPLRITISLGTATLGDGQLVSVDVSPTSSEVELEKVEPDRSDPEYQHRPGYQRTFLGFDVPFPRLTNAVRSKAFTLPGQCGDERFELKYHHFSVILNKDRMLAFVAGVNYHPTASVQHPRDKDGDRWYFDPRVSAAGRFQAGEGLYAGNPLDRGHLVRRADAGWGATKKEAKLANDDTFHFTNCSPQHAITNQGQVKQAPPGLRLWGSLEDHVASQGKKTQRKLNIFNGPVFRSTDELYRGVKIPVEFWKVVVFENDAGDPAVAAFVLSQAALIADLEEEFEIGQYKTVQVKVKDLETKTQLDFGPFRSWDVLESDGAEEHFTRGAPAIVLESLDDILL